MEILMVNVTDLVGWPHISWIEYISSIMHTDWKSFRLPTKEVQYTWSDRTIPAMNLTEPQLLCEDGEENCIKWFWDIVFLPPLPCSGGGGGGGWYIISQVERESYELWANSSNIALSSTGWNFTWAGQRSDCCDVMWSDVVVHSNII